MGAHGESFVLGSSSRDAHNRFQINRVYTECKVAAIDACGVQFYVKLTMLVTKLLANGDISQT